MKRIEGIDTLNFDVTPKEFAEDIFNRYFGVSGVGYFQAKTCAILTIDLLIEELDVELEDDKFLLKTNLYEGAKKHLLKL